MSVMSELLTKVEPLCDELERHKSMRPTIGEMIHHPLVVEIMIHPDLFALYNKRLQYKKEELAEALEEKNYIKAVWLHERPYRFQALMRYRELLEPKQYWEIVGQVWTDSENIWQHITAWRLLWASKASEHTACMDEDEMARYNSLANTTIIYRGTNIKASIKGISWTTDRDKAIWFAKRLKQKKRKAYLAQAYTLKEHVKAVFLGRNENEIVTLRPQGCTVEVLE